MAKQVINASLFGLKQHSINLKLRFQRQDNPHLEISAEKANRNENHGHEGSWGGERRDVRGRGWHRRGRASGANAIAHAGHDIVGGTRRAS